MIDVSFEIIQYFIIFVLTFYVSSLIIRYNSKIRARGIKSIMSSQSVIHNRTKIFMPNNFISKSIVSQSYNHIQKYVLKVMFVDQNAYWIKDNTFFTADVKNGTVVQETTRKVDTLNMSKLEIDKMMFIIDKLKES